MNDKFMAEAALKKTNQDRHHQELEQGIREHWARIKSHVQCTLEEAHSCGDKLTELKTKLPHGVWGVFLEEIGLPERTAQTWMRISKVPLDQALAHGSIRQILAIEAPKNQIRRAAYLPQSEKNTTAPVEPTDDNEDSDLRSEIARLRDERVELEERLGLLDSPHEQALASLQNQLAVSKKQTASWQSKFQEEQRKCSSLRKRIKKLEEKTAHI